MAWYDMYVCFVIFVQSSTYTKSTPSVITSCKPEQIFAVGESSSTQSSIDELSDDDIVSRSSTGKQSAAQLDSDSDNDPELDIQTSEQPKDEKKYKRFKLIKSKEDNVPLPDLFELPKNVRPDVASALASGKVTLETNAFFLSTIAGAMFTYKQYPTSDDYKNVARAICAKYPFMKAPTGKPYVSCDITGETSHLFLSHVNYWYVVTWIYSMLGVLSNIFVHAAKKIGCILLHLYNTQWQSCVPAL